jgi:hypothetical protein
MNSLRMRRGLWAVAVACLALATVYACASLVNRVDRIKFSHKEHIANQGLDCKDCHAEVVASEKVGAGPMKEAKCMDCHEKAEGTCGQCHTDPKRPGTWADSTHRLGVTFSHKAHLGRPNVNCGKCHGATADRVAPAQRSSLGHDTCMSCHRKDYRKIDCRKCHSDLVENPSAPLDLFSHDGDFLKRHGTLARGDDGVCSHCHTQTDCTDCHSRLDPMSPAMRNAERVDKSLVHRADFLTRHPIDAKADPTSCTSCHTTNQCTSCHEKSGISQSSVGWDRPSPHPAGWAMEKSSSNFHGREARRDIVACASCHDRGAASNCVTCHRSGGPGGSPHPRGWSPSGSRSGPACRACHGN